MPIVIFLIVAIIILAAEREYDSNLLHIVWAMPWLDRSALFSITFVPLLILVALTISRRRMIAHRTVTHAIIVALLAIGSLGFVLLYSPTNATASIAAIAAVAATIGWLLQRQAAFDLSRKQHTLNILLQLRQSEVFNRHRARIFSKFPDSVTINQNDAEMIYAERLNGSLYIVDETSGKMILPMVESIRYVCNYFEFLSAAVYHGDIDDALLHASLGPIMKKSYVKFANFMQLTMDLDSDGKPNPDSAFRYYWWLTTQHWA